MIWNINKKKYNCGKNVYLMGILNVTPDSFYDGSKFNRLKQAKEQVEKIVREGADMIDIGGESSRPGSDKVTIKEEINRILPVIKYIKKNYKIPVSVDTFKSDVAKAALDEGVEIINDISGLKSDKKMAGTIAAYGASVVLMHIKGIPKTMQNNPIYRNLMKEIADYLEDSIKIALDNSIKFNNIVVDPGIGFGKTTDHNYLIIKKLQELKKLNRPILIGLSRKSIIGNVLDNRADERLNGTLTLNIISIMNGASIIRVHDIREHKEALKLAMYYKNVK